jgi:hypothetical protein
LGENTTVTLDQTLMTTLHNPSRSPTASSSDGCRRALGQTIQRVRRRLVWRGTLRWIGSTAGLLLLGILLDYAVQFNAMVRWCYLAGCLYLLFRLYQRWIGAALRVHPAQSDMALNLPTPATRLAAVVDLQTPDVDDDMSKALLEAVERRASNRLGETPTEAPLRSGPLYEMVLIGIAVAVVFLIGINQPDAARIGIKRVLTPWTTTDWPKRFAIELPEAAEHHASDRAYIARAMIGPSTESPGASLRWRLLGPENETVVRWTTLGLNKQGRGEQDSTPYEQLIPIHTLTAASIPDGSLLEYRVQTHDDQSPIQRVTIVHPPKLNQLRADVQLPDYAQQLDSDTIRFLRGSHETTPNAPSFGPILAGSKIELSWGFNTPVHEREDPSSESNVITKAFLPDSSTTVSVVPIDEYGLSTREPMDVFLRVVEDAPPEALLTSPSSDSVIGNRAEIELEALVSDDLGLQDASIELQLLDDQEHEPQVLIKVESIDTRSDMLTTVLDLRSLELVQGQRLGITAIATDIQGSVSRSTLRTLRIVEDQEIVDLVESQLSSMSEVLKRLDDRQRSLIDTLKERSDQQPSDQSGNQSSISDQIRSRTETARSLMERLEENRIDDPQLTPILEALDEALDRASDQSERASDSLQQEQREEAIEQMERVRDQLETSIAMLDRGKDTWLARRSIEGLRSQVEELLSETQKLDAQSGGRSLDQMSEDQRSMLQKILDKQRRAAEEAREMIDALDQQADALEQQNPTGAQGIRDAATQGRNSGIEEQLEQAAGELEQNQTASAAGTQQQVLEELDNMLEQIEQAQKNRDSALRRKLASIMESIEGLIQDQSVQIAKLDANEPNLDRPLIALQSNTLAVRDEAATAFPETQSIADSMSRAADAQSDAIASIRSNPADLISARQSELSSLTHLQAALDEAKKQDQMAEDRQKTQLRNELRGKYQDAFKEQSRITTDTEALVGEALDRRQRAAARQLSRSESDLRDTLGLMLDETKELNDAPIFSLAHDQLDRMLDSVSVSLNERTLDPLIINDQQGIATILQALIDVLGDQQQEQSEDFEDGQGGGGGGQGGGGDQPVIPPVAQLQLLKALQELTAMQTRAIAEQDSPNPDRVREIGRMQRELSQKGQELIEGMNPDPQPIEQEVEDQEP